MNQLHQNFKTPNPDGEAAPTSEEANALMSGREAIQEEEHKQTMRERWQRLIFGWIVGPIVLILPFFFLKWLWAFIDTLPISDKSEMWTLATFMFSSTYIAVIALYGGILAAVFQKIGDKKTNNDKSFGILERIESTLDNSTKNNKP